MTTKTRVLIEYFMNVLVINYTMRLVWVIVSFVSILSFETYYAFADFHVDETILIWSQANYKIVNGTGIVTIIVNDNDKNEIPFFAEITD